MRIQLQICVFAACALAALGAARGNDDSSEAFAVADPAETLHAASPIGASSMDGPAASNSLSTQDAEALAQWAERQAELAIINGESAEAVQEKKQLAVWARAQADEAASPADIAPAAGFAADPLASPVVFNQAEALPGQAPILPRFRAGQPTFASQPPPGPPATVDATLSDDGQEVVPTPTPVDGVIVDGYGSWDDIYGMCSVCCCSGLFLGVEGTFLAPVGEPTTGVLLTDLVSGATYSGTSQPGLGAGVRTWLGLQNCNGTGFVVRYWTFGNQVINPDPVVPVNKQPAFHNSYFLNAYALDIEMIQRFCWHGTRWYATFGGRYARLERNQLVAGYGTVGDVSLYGLAQAANEIEGAGFTTSLWATGPLCGCCLPCGFNWYGGARISILWADSLASAYTEANAAVKPPIGAAVANSIDAAFASKDHSETIFIAEAQAGIQYEHCLPCHNAIFFARAGFEYQHWNTGDVFAGSNSFAFLAGGPPPFGGRVDAFANAHDGNLDLIGFVLGAGLTY
ncbi:MAG TPA: hypothetical protein VFV87_04995 [Pirellulaceae bacterium]|nr:hypothetical protein [Pirellulaceae bacterium]